MVPSGRDAGFPDLSGPGLRGGAGDLRLGQVAPVGTFAGVEPLVR